MNHCIDVVCVCGVEYCVRCYTVCLNCSKSYKSKNKMSENKPIEINTDKHVIRFNPLMAERKYPQFVYVNGPIDNLASFLYDRGLHIDADLTEVSKEHDEVNLFVINSSNYNAENLMNALMEYAALNN